MNTIDKLIAEIERARDELAKMESALEVIQRIEGIEPPQQPLFTLTKRVDQPLPVTPRKQRKASPRAKPGTARYMIIELLKRTGPQPTQTIIRDTNLREKTVHNTVRVLREYGLISKQDDGTYALHQ